MAQATGRDVPRFVFHGHQHSELLPHVLEIEGCAPTSVRARSEGNAAARGASGRTPQQRQADALIACEGLKPFGQTSVQFMIVRQR